jgi:hypothetical protein
MKKDIVILVGVGCVLLAMLFLSQNVKENFDNGVTTPTTLQNATEAVKQIILPDPDSTPRVSAEEMAEKVNYFAVAQARIQTESMMETVRSAKLQNDRAERELQEWSDPQAKAARLALLEQTVEGQKIANKQIQLDGEMRRYAIGSGIALAALSVAVDTAVQLNQANEQSRFARQQLGANRQQMAQEKVFYKNNPEADPRGRMPQLSGGMPTLARQMPGMRMPGMSGMGGMGPMGGMGGMGGMGPMGGMGGMGPMGGMGGMGGMGRGPIGGMGGMGPIGGMARGPMGGMGPMGRGPMSEDPIADEPLPTVNGNRRPPLR